MIDTHAHLDACDDEPAELLARAGRRGRDARRHHRDRHRFVSAGARDRGVAAGRVRRARDRPPPGRHPGGATGSTTSGGSWGIRGSSPWGRRGSTATTGPARSPEQRALFDAHLGLAEELRLPVVIHSREAERRDGGRTRRVRRSGRPALLLGARPAGAGARAWLLRLVRRERHVSEGEPAPRGGGARSRGQDPRRDGQPVPRAPARARTAERADERDAHARDARRRAR